MQDIQITDSSTIENEYIKAYNLCLNTDEYKLVERREMKIGELNCEVYHFFSQTGYKPVGMTNVWFFFVNGNIIANGNEWMENCSVFGIEF